MTYCLLIVGCARMLAGRSKVTVAGLGMASTLKGPWNGKESLLEGLSRWAGESRAWLDTSTRSPPRGCSVRRCTEAASLAMACS